MNPPFEANADTRHIARARAMLVPGGRLVAIASCSFPARSDAATTELREALVRANATIEPLAAGTFKESGTNASAVLIVVDEPLPVVRGVSAEHRAAVASLTTVKAKWRDFLTEQQKRTPTGPWQPFGTTSDYAGTSRDRQSLRSGSSSRRIANA